MLYTLASFIIKPCPKRYSKVFSIGSSGYLMLHYYLFKQRKNELIDKYKTYIYLLMIVDLLVAVIRMKQSKTHADEQQELIQQELAEKMKNNSIFVPLQKPNIVPQNINGEKSSNQEVPNPIPTKISHDEKKYIKDEEEKKENDDEAGDEDADDEEDDEEDANDEDVDEDDANNEDERETEIPKYKKK